MSTHKRLKKNVVDRQQFKKFASPSYQKKYQILMKINVIFPSPG
jgi:hypothetical protein